MDPAANPGASAALSPCPWFGMGRVQQVARAQGLPASWLPTLPLAGGPWSWCVGGVPPVPPGLKPKHWKSPALGQVARACQQSALPKGSPCVPPSRSAWQPGPGSHCLFLRTEPRVLGGWGPRAPASLSVHGVRCLFHPRGPAVCRRGPLSVCDRPSRCRARGSRRPGRGRTGTRSHACC